MNESVDPKAGERLRTILAGFSGDETTIRAALSSAHAKTRSSALRALERMGTLTEEDLASTVTDESEHIRRRVAQLGAHHTSDLAGFGLKINAVQDLRAAVMQRNSLGFQHYPRPR